MINNTNNTSNIYNTFGINDFLWLYVISKNKQLLFTQKRKGELLPL